MPPSVHNFLRPYTLPVQKQALHLHLLLLELLPGINVHLDEPARIIMFNYGPKYVHLVCNIIPSKSALKLGFPRGTRMPNAQGLLQGNGKLSRFMVIPLNKDLPTASIKILVSDALNLYLQDTTGEH